MRTVIWLLRIVVFLLLFGLAIKNSGNVELRFFFDAAVTWPLALVVLATFVAGTAVGISATLLTLLRQRREIGRLKKAAGGSAES
jgi:putative membrane protein